MKIDRDNKYFIELIVKHCQRIHDFTKRFNGSKKMLLQDMAYQECVTMSILQIGENANNLDDDFKKNYNEQPWDDIIKARHKITHHYDEIDVDFVWEIINNDLPLLQKYCEKILNEL
ncbi:MAG: DUF86 domain-containing protein [Phascolarctobacterium sp.]|nr:DUF86 domain-containing protein [Candidatus Phascolarctobacterium caballi]